MITVIFERQQCEMKIICIGRNYSEHAMELKNDIPDEPVIFLKPQSSLLQKGKDFYYPDFTQDLHYECELVLKICKNGKHIREKFAHKYYNRISVGIDFTARDIQQKQKEKRLPWEIAKAFDNSAVTGRFIDIDEERKKQPFRFKLLVNGAEKQSGNSAYMIFSADKIISYVSQYFTLNTGDLIFTGTPKGVGAIAIGDKLEGYLEEEKLFELSIK